MSAPFCAVGVTCKGPFVRSDFGGRMYWVCDECLRYGHYRRSRRERKWTTKMVLDRIREERSPVTAKQLTARLKIHRGTLNWHLNKLKRSGAILWERGQPIKEGAA